MNKISLNFRPKPWLLWLLLAAIAATGGVLYIGLSHSWLAVRETQTEATPTELPGVSALGRLEPAGEIVQVAAPTGPRWRSRFRSCWWRWVTPLM